MIKIVVVLCVISNVLAALFGLTLTITGSICVSNTHDIQHMWPELFVLSILSIVIGILTIFFAVGLIYCIINQSVNGAQHFSYLLIISTLCAMICSIILLVGRSSLQPNVLNKTTAIFNGYSDKKYENTNRIVNRLQQRLQCCGIRKATDWENHLSNKKSVPDSCCDFMIKDCGKDALNTLEDIHKNGCVQPLYQYLEKRYSMLIGMHITLTIFAFASCLMGFYVQSYIQNRYDVM